MHLPYDWAVQGLRIHPYGNRSAYTERLQPLLIATGEAIPLRGLDGFPGLPGAPLRGLEGVPGLPGAPQEEAGLTRKFETSHVGGATGRTPPM